MENNLTVAGSNAEQVLAKANQVIEALETLRQAYQELCNVASTSTVKSQCHSDIHSLYTKESLLVYALKKEGVKPINPEEFV